VKEHLWGNISDLSRDSIERKYHVSSLPPN